ncbi:hypothetical protein ACFQYP_46810 [Nonomuraea antimicrobica]
MLSSVADSPGRSFSSRWMDGASSQRRNASSYAPALQRAWNQPMLFRTRPAPAR